MVTATTSRKYCSRMRATNPCSLPNLGPTRLKLERKDKPDCCEVHGKGFDRPVHAAVWSLSLPTNGGRTTTTPNVREIGGTANLIPMMRSIMTLILRST